MQCIQFGKQTKNIKKNSKITLLYTQNTVEALSCDIPFVFSISVLKHYHLAMRNVQACCGYVSWKHPKKGLFIDGQEIPPPPPPSLLY